MSKAAKIRELYAKGKSDKEIARIVGCSQSYVRTAARQRINGKDSASDKKYRAKIGCGFSTLRYRRDPQYRRMKNAYCVTRARMLRAGHPIEFALKKAREAWAEAK